MTQTILVAFSDRTCLSSRLSLEFCGATAERRAEDNHTRQLALELDPMGRPIELRVLTGRRLEAVRHIRSRCCVCSFFEHSIHRSAVR